MGAARARTTVNNRLRGLGLSHLLAILAVAAGCGYSPPAPPEHPVHIRSVDGGQLYTCGLFEVDSIRCWGYDASGQLGDGTFGTPTTDPVPEAVVDLGGVLSVSAGWDHACALMDDQTVRCWGSDGGGKSGDGTVGAPDTASSPIAVAGLTDVVSISAGEVHSCAVRADGTVWCWGADVAGRLGDGLDGSPVDNPTPVQVLGVSDALEVSAGGTSSCALLESGSVACWGYDAQGQLGDGSVNAAADPVADVVAGVSHATEVSVGETFACALIDDGSVWCWGEDTWGQLGDGTAAAPQMDPTPSPVFGISNAVDISAGFTSACAIRATGEALCWGYDGGGRLGDGVRDSPSFNPVPATVVTIPPVSEISVGVSHACARAVDPDDGLWCWGDDSAGELGDGMVSTPEYNPVPHRVQGT